jgi:hypothetical protein
VVLDKLGAQYESEHAKDLKDTLYYLPHEAHGLGWQVGLYLGCTTVLAEYKIMITLHLAGQAGATSIVNLPTRCRLWTSGLTHTCWAVCSTAGIVTIVLPKI